MAKTRLGILGSGRGSNMQAVVDACQAGSIDAEVALVVSDVETAQILERARDVSIPALYLDPGPKKSRLTPEREQHYVEVLKNHGVELVLLAGFMRIIGTVLIKAFPYAIMNIHPSLLPSFKGLEAQKQALEYGVRYAGCTVHFVDESVDGGPIILQSVVPVEPNDTADLLAERILKEEHQAYPDAVQLFAEGRLEVEGRRVRIRNS